MIWAIYVSDKPHSRINFPIGMSNGIWGVHDKKKNTIQNVEKGDLVAFVYSISWIKAEGTPPKGFSRVSEEKVELFRGIVKKVIFGTVTKTYYESHSQVWPDDIYPHRFDFLLERELKSVPFGTEFYNSEFVNAVRRSACTQGSLQPCKSVQSLNSLYNHNYSSAEGATNSNSVMEGRPIYRLHKKSERSTKIISDKKAQVMQANGKLECEVCSFDFNNSYGEHGDGYIECHHTNPVGLREDNEKTSLEDLILLCANCHRMVHRKSQWLSIEELSDVYKNR